MISKKKYNYSLIEIPGFDLLLEEVELNNNKGIIAGIEKIFGKAREDSYAPEVIKGNIAVFQMNMLKLINELSGDQTDISCLFKNLKPDIMDMDDIKRELINSCIQAAEYINTFRKREKAGIISEVKKYIDNNYYKDIILKNLAEKYRVNPIYLGQIFNKSLKISFNDYLHQVRIKNAESLLIDGDTKISNIAAMVGYKDFNYFIRKFKELVNTTPIKYRESYKRDGGPYKKDKELTL